jgi:hypothetical protein
MPSRFLALVTLLCLTPAAFAQREAPARFQLYGGYSFLSNSLNGVTGSHQGLSGYEAAFAFPSWHGLRFKVDYNGYRGTNLGSPQHPYYILGGPQFGHRLGKETVFVEGLAGTGGANQSWGTNGALGQTAAFAAYMGGGLDTPLTRRIAFRVEGGYQYSYFELNTKNRVPYTIPGLPNNFGRISSGLVWKF